MISNILKKISSKSIHLLFVLIVFFLFILSISRHCEVDLNTYYQVKHISEHQPWLYLLLAFFIACLLMILYAIINVLVKRKTNLFFKKIICIILALEAAVSSVWILFNDTIPHSDQRILFEEARKIAGYSTETFNHQYVIAFKFQKFVILLLSLLTKLFGDSQMPFRWFNVIGAILLVLGLTLLMKEGTTNVTASILISIVSLFFYPITIYTCYLYGTLWAVTSEVWAFYGIIAFCNKTKSGDIPSPKSPAKYGVISIIFFSLGIQMHLSALIGMVAGIIYLVLRIDKSNFKNILTLILGIICFYLLTSTAIDKTYDIITNCPNGDAIPISAKIYMGTTSPETQPWGPGSQDGSYWKVYELNDYSASKTNEYLLPILIDIAKDYMTGKRDLSFFLKKIEYQWLDPSIDAHRIILLNNQENDEPTNSKAFTDFYYSNLRTLAFKILTVFMIVIYGFSLVSGIHCLLKNTEINIHFLIQLFFIGGFVFQIFAESASRYIVSYYVLLLIETVFGIAISIRYIIQKAPIIISSWGDHIYGNK